MRIALLASVVTVFFGCSSIGKSCCHQAVNRKNNELVRLVKNELVNQNLSLIFLGIPQVESSFNPNARGRDGSVGLWQLQPKTARALGLRVDTYVDERLDAYKSTKAAVKFLRILKNRFGSDRLVLAGYQLGETKLSRILKNGKPLPRQVENYIKRVEMASKQMLSTLA